MKIKAFISLLVSFALLYSFVQLIVVKTPETRTQNLKSRMISTSFVVVNTECEIRRGADILFLTSKSGKVYEMLVGGRLPCKDIRSEILLDDVVEIFYDPNKNRITDFSHKGITYLKLDDYIQASSDSFQKIPWFVLLLSCIFLSISIYYFKKQN